MGDILKGRIPNKLVPLKHKVDGRWVDLGLGTISPIRDDAGNVQLRIFTRLTSRSTKYRRIRSSSRTRKSSASKPTDIWVPPRK